MFVDNATVVLVLDEVQFVAAYVLVEIPKSETKTKTKSVTSERETETQDCKKSLETVWRPRPGPNLPGSAYC